MDPRADVYDTTTPDDEADEPDGEAVDKRRGEVTRLLLAWRDGDADAFERLLPLVEGDLRRLARHYLAGERDATLQATELLDELCVRLLDTEKVRWKDRAHFVGCTARIMKQILVDGARRRLAVKRKDGVRPLPLREADEAVEADQQLIALDDALERLAVVHERQSRVVELKSFTGLSLEEIAEALDVSVATVKRDWRAACAWLRREMS